MALTQTAAQPTYPPQVGQGKGWKAYRPHPRPAKAKPLPYARPVTVTLYRDPITGHFAAKPSATAQRVTIPRPRQGSELRFTRRFTVWPEEGLKELMGVRVRAVAARRARLRGELPVADLRAFEADLANDDLTLSNPDRLAEWELAEMHAAHRSDKARRGAVSKGRNARARAAQEAQQGPRQMQPAPQVSASVSVPTAALLAALAALDPAALGRVTFKVRKEAGRPATLELATPSGLASYPLG